MFSKADLCLGCSIPLTFSTRKNLGFFAFRIRIKSKNNCPRLSSIPRLAPASLQLWQGGPPIIPIQSGTSSELISVILRLSSCVLGWLRSEEHTSELQSRPHLVCRLLLEKKKNK